jgi:hypothetical protein
MRIQHFPAARPGRAVAALLALAAALLSGTPCLAAGQDGAAPAVALPAAAPAMTGPAMVLRGVLAQKVAFQGAVNYDNAGTGAGMLMYPAPGGLAGLLVAVATHAAISGGVREAEKKALRDKADLILAPHQEWLNGYTLGELFLDAHGSIASAGNVRIVEAQAPLAADEIVIDTVPLFSMTQDRRSLILENAIAIHAKGRAQPFNIAIRIVSPARDATVDAAYWFDASGARLKQTTAGMIARSIDVAMSHMRDKAGPASPFRTVRYNEGGAERIERAEVLRVRCEDLELRTLRGNVMVVPRRASDEAAEGLCAKAEPG